VNELFYYRFFMDVLYCVHIYFYRQLIYLHVVIVHVFIFRLVMEDDKVFVYHNLENSRMLHSTELQCIEVNPPVSCSVTVQTLVTI